jgi:hypothetical protein
VGALLSSDVWTLGANPGSFLFYWSAPVLAWLIIDLVGNYREYHALRRERMRHYHERADEKARLDADEARLLREARGRAARHIAIALAIALGGTAVTTLIAWLALS